MALPRSISRPGKLLSLQAARGAAAMLVVLHHVAVTLALPKYMGFVVAGGVFAPLGRAGVDLFFVLSGFIIYYVHHGDIGHPQRVWIYTARRLARIYPTYWAVLALFLAALFVDPLPGFGDARRLGTIIQAALLIPFTGSGERTIVGVAWTLSHELLFYGLFALLIAAPRLGRAVLAAWFLALLAGRLLPELAPPLNFFLHVKNFEFFIGMGVARLLLAQTLRPAWATVLAGAAGFVAVAAVELQGFDFQESAPTLLYGLAAAAMIFALASLEAQGRISTVPKLLVELGAASYSIYLIHQTIVIGLIKGAHLAGFGGQAGLVLFPAVAALAAMGGFLLYLVVERPVLRGVHRRLDAARAAPLLGARATPS